MKTLLPEINSADKRFHAGNPATGEQGTRVTDTWLNNLQDRVRDVQAEAHYVLQKAGFTPKAETQTQLYQAIVKIIDDNRKTATTKGKGEVKLNSATDSSSETEAATPKAVKSAYDRAINAENNNKYQKIYIGQSGDLNLDLTNRKNVFDIFGGNYREHGYLTLATHNTPSNNIQGLPLTMRSPVVLSFYLMGGYSIFYCHYVMLNRKFFSVANINNATYKLNWIEEISNTGEQTINNQLVINTNGWSKIRFPIDNGGEWRQEFNTKSEDDPRFNFVYTKKDKTQRYVSFPAANVNQTVAYHDWVNNRIEENFMRGNLTTQNLNDVKVYGVYGQAANNQATIERNYPVNFAGTLLVMPSAYGVMQKYINFRSGETYQRNVNIDLRTWSEWRRIDGLNSVSRSGDKMTGSLMIEGRAPGGFANGLMLKNKAGGQNTGVFVDFFQSDNIPRASMFMRDAGNNSTQIEFLNTPEGADWYRDSRQTVFTITSAGELWSKPYGLLHDYFAKQDDIRNVWNELNNTYRKNRYRHQYYPHHYNGAEVFDIPMADNGVMRVIIMNVTINGYAKVNLPEAFNGSCVVQATDVGGGQKSVGANIQNGNVVEIHNRGQTDFQILAIGWYGW